MKVSIGGCSRKPKRSRNVNKGIRYSCFKNEGKYLNKCDKGIKFETLNYFKMELLIATLGFIAGFFAACIHYDEKINK